MGSSSLEVRRDLARGLAPARIRERRNVKTKSLVKRINGGELAHDRDCLDGGWVANNIGRSINIGKRDCRRVLRQMSSELLQFFGYSTIKELTRTSRSCDGDPLISGKRCPWGRQVIPEPAVDRSYVFADRNGSVGKVEHAATLHTL